MSNIVKHYDKKFYFDEYVITRLQTGNWDQDVNDEDIEEIGNSGIVETIIDPNIDSTVTLNMNDWGSVDALAQMLGTEATNPYIPGTENDYVLSSDDLKAQNVDIVVRVADHDTGNLDRTVWIPNAKLETVAWSYSIDGNATENYTFKGNTDRHFIGDNKEGFVGIGTQSGSNTFTVNAFNDATPRYVGKYVSVNGKIYSFTGCTWADVNQYNEINVSGSSTIPALASGDRIRLFFVADSSSTTYTELDSSGIGAIKGSYVEIELTEDSQVSNGQDHVYTTKLQSVDVTSTVTRDDIKELGNFEVVDRPFNKHEVVVEATALEDDLENWAYMLGVTSSQWAARDTTGLDIKLQDSIGVDQKLEVRVYDDYNKGTLLKTLSVTGLTLTKSPFGLDVGGMGQLQMSFKADNWHWSGEGTGTSTRLAASYPTGYPYSDKYATA